jgi:peptidoglycan/LPS O-acetylase OafA/YrhL
MFLTNKFAVLIGDASYSIYLVHWPLFIWHRYANMEQYPDEQEADFFSKQF